MFTKEIQRTTFTTQIADELFTNIRGNGFRNDFSFLSTLRALLHERMNEDEYINLSFTSTSYSMSQISESARSSSMDEMFCQLVNPRTVENQLLIHSLANNDSENNSAVLEFVRRSFNSVYGDDYVRAEDLSLFVKKLTDADFYINEKQKTTVIVVCNLDLKKLHMIQSFLPRLLPWYFKDRKQLTDEEKPLLLSLTKANAVEYATLIEQFAKKFDFRSVQIRKLLDGFENIFEKRQLESLARDMQDIESDLRSLENSYAETLKRKTNNLVQQLGLTERMNEKKESEIMEYFLCNSSLHLQSVQGTALEFIAETYLDNYDPEMFERMIANERSVFYSVTNSKFSKEDAKELLIGLFGEDAQLKIKVCAAYKLDLERTRAEGRSNYTFPPSFENHLPNQHIQRHACLGSNGQYINKCLQNRDYILAIEQCVASARNFNMADGTVADEFVRAIFSPSAKKFVLLPDGTSCTPVKALEWLRKNNETEVERDEQTD